VPTIRRELLTTHGPVFDVDSTAQPLQFSEVTAVVLRLAPVQSRFGGYALDGGRQEQNAPLGSHFRPVQASQLSVTPFGAALIAWAAESSKVYNQAGISGEPIRTFYRLIQVFPLARSTVKVSST